VGRRVFGLFHHICFIHLEPADKTNPLAVAASFVNGLRSAAVEDFSEEQISVLKDCLDDLDDAELIARVADLIWMRQRKGNYQCAERAVAAYLESGQRLLGPDDLGFGVHRLTRALHLANSLGRASDALPKAIEVLRDIVEHSDPAEEGSLKLLLDLLFEFSHEKPLEYAQIAGLHAQWREGRNAWPYARGAWETASRWYRAAGDNDGANACLVRISDCWVREAEDVLASDQNMSSSIAASHMQSAIEALRRVPETETQRQQLQKRMLALQSKSVDEFGRISGGVDLSGIIEQAIAAVSRDTLREALFELCLLANPPVVSDLRCYAENGLQEAVFYSLVSWQSVDDQGRVVARRASYLGGAPEEREAALLAEMHVQAGMQEGALGRVIDIARRHILLDHRPALEDFFEIASYTPFVRPGKELIFARGLLAGMEGDYLVALHLLVLQIEDSLRYLLERRGVVTSKLTSEGIQDVVDINDLLKMAELRSVLGDDLVFDLEGLLTDRFGGNFRNKLAHGLLYSGAFYSDNAAYIWWSILRLCCIPLIKLTETPDADAHQAADVSTATAES